MPKKSATVRGGAQRNKPKVQKSFELVKPEAASSTGLTESTEEQELVANGEDEVTTSDISAASPVEVEAETPVEETKPRVTKEPERKTREVKTSSAVAIPVETRKATSSRTSSAPVAASSAPVSPPAATTPPKGSASARLAARRQAMQKAQQRVAASLITSDHYSYVRRDLRTIAILAAIMFAVIIILHFVPGIGS